VLYLPNFKVDDKNGNSSQIRLAMGKYTITNSLKFLSRKCLYWGPEYVFKVIVCIYVVPVNVFFEGRLMNYAISNKFRKVVIEWLAVWVVALFCLKNLFCFSLLKPKWRANLSTKFFWNYYTQIGSALTCLSHLWNKICTVYCHVPASNLMDRHYLLNVRICYFWLFM
jgi:hypothetical protein